MGFLVGITDNSFLWIEIDYKVIFKIMIGSETFFEQKKLGQYKYCIIFFFEKKQKKHNHLDIYQFILFYRAIQILVKDAIDAGYLQVFMITLSLSFVFFMKSFF